MRILLQELKQLITFLEQVRLNVEDSRLLLLINDCWATPSRSSKDRVSYKIIKDG